MATELEAKKARDLHFDLLTKSGAHALAIDAIKGPKKKSFAIIAFTEGKNELPENVENKPALNIFDNLFSNHKQSHIVEEEPKKEDSPITNALQQIFKNQIFVKKEDIQKKQRKSNTTFKNKKSKNQRISQKVYPINSSSDQDVDLVQSPMGQELQQEDDQ